MGTTRSLYQMLRTLPLIKSMISRISVVNLATELRISHL